MMVLKSNRSLMIVGLAVFGMLATIVQAEVIVSKSLLNQDNPQNATIYKSSADTPYQPANWTWRNEVRGENTNLARKAYYKFDLSGVAEGQTVDSATLTFYFQTNGLDTGAAVVHGFGIYGITSGDDGWSGTDLTWNNSLAGGDYAYLGNVDHRSSVAGASTVLLGTFTHTGQTTAGLQMTVSGEALVNFLNTRSEATGLATFAIVGYDGVNEARSVHYIATGNPIQAGYAPTLTMTTVPEPTSIMLVAGGIAALVARKRSRKL